MSFGMCGTVVWVLNLAWGDSGSNPYSAMGVLMYFLRILIYFWLFYVFNFFKTAFGLQKVGYQMQQTNK